MTTNSYQILRQAILARQPVTCRYKGHVREVCPHILGTTGKREKVLAWQFAGGSNSPGGLPIGGEWRCMFVDEITLAVTTPGEWHAGRDHRWDQTCVEKVDVDVGTE
jgi:hypothetical protein